METRRVDAGKFSQYARTEVSQSLLFILKEYNIGFEQLSNMTEKQLVWLFEAVKAKGEKDKEEKDKMEREMERERRKARSSTPRVPRYRPRGRR